MLSVFKQDEVESFANDNSIFTLIVGAKEKRVPFLADRRQTATAIS